MTFSEPREERRGNQANLVVTRLPTIGRRWFSAQSIVHLRYLLPEEALHVRVLTWSQGKNGQVLGKEIYRELPSRQWPHPAQEILSAKNNWKLGKHLPDVSYMLSLLFPKHLFIVTEMNTGLDGPLIQPSITVLTSTFVGLNKHQRSVDGKGENQNLPSFHS